jgi:flavorubredoxin
LAFVEAPMLHWPDSMFTYLAPDGVLMSNDAFGQHYATAFRFNDLVNREELYQEAVKYYANILAPFSSRVGPKIDELLAMNVPVSMIAPSHGVIWRDDPMQIVQQYRQWARQEPQKRAVILYDTMWQATRRMAEAISDGLAERGVGSTLFHMATTDRNDVITEVFGAKAVVVGSPTLNNGVLPSMTPILEDLRGLKFKNKVGAAFGSYGWSGECVKQIEERLVKAGIPLAAPGVRAKWQPTADDLQACRELGRRVADAVLKEEG